MVLSTVVRSVTNGARFISRRKDYKTEITREGEEDARVERKSNEGEETHWIVIPGTTRSLDRLTSWGIVRKEGGRTTPGGGAKGWPSGRGRQRRGRK